MRHRHGIWIAALLVAMVGSDGFAPPVPEATLNTYAKACFTYENRARFRARNGPTSFVVAMADGCLAAQRSLDAEGGAERRSAIAYLDRLVDLRNTVIAINMDRIYGANASPFAKPIAGEGRLMAMGGVSESGEFLIAHRMGLLEAFDDWRAQTTTAGALALSSGSAR
ncbi:MAG: hypothetical protein AAGC57_01735 [Pseudomonadota bacterium]